MSISSDFPPLSRRSPKSEQQTLVGSGSSGGNDRASSIKSRTPALNRRHCGTLGIAVLCFLLGMTAQRHLNRMPLMFNESLVATQSSKTVTKRMPVQSTKNNSATTTPNDNNVVYGHIHIMKTGGTSLNGILATKYERICGHKGYSYDAILQNERVQSQGNKLLAGLHHQRYSP